MSRRWAPPKPKTPQQELTLPSRGRFTPAVKLQPDTAIKASEALGMYRGGDLAQAMVRVLEKHRARTALGGVMLAIEMRKEVYDYLAEHSEGATADEIARELKRSAFTIRPRVSELYHSHKILDSGARHKNASGRNAIVWKIAESETPGHQDGTDEHQS